jgi:type I restriction enzyme, S subunit
MRNGWKELRLGDVVAQVLDFRGRTPLKLGMGWGGGTIPALSAVNVRDGRLDLTRTPHFGSDALYERWMTQGDAQRGDVLITTEAPLGNIAQIPDERRYILSQRVILLKPRKEVIESDFLALQMRSGRFQSLLDANRSGTTATGIRQSRLVELPVHVPPLNEQRRIVAKLEALQSRSRRAREALDAVPPLLEKLRQSILAAAFRGDLTKDWRAQNPNAEPASALLARLRTERRQKWEVTELAKLKAKGKAPTNDSWKVKYKEPDSVDTTGLPELPETWCWASLDELLDATRGAAYGVLKPGPHVEGGVRFIKSGQVRDGYLDLSYDFRISAALDNEFKRTRLRGGEVLLNLVGASIGRSAIAPDDLVGANVTRAIGVLPVIGGWAYWLQAALEGPEGQRLVRNATGGSAQGVLNLEEVRSLAIPLLPVRERDQVLTRLKHLRDQPATLTDSAHALANAIARLNSAILARAFRGELVTQDPKDEPAPTALARLKPDAAAESPRRPSRRDKAAE